MRLALLLLCALLAGCATKMNREGQKETVVDPKYLLKGDVDRVIDTTRREVLDGLMLVADKLYRRNPKEWRNAGFASREAALDQLKKRIAPPVMEGKTEGPAAMLAFREDYAGDRVAALMMGLLTMVDAAFENKTDFYVFDRLNELKLHNCARNIEIALWKLNTAKNAAGDLFLLSNELEAANRNLSFEREFGRLIGQMDLLAHIVADTHGRTLSRVGQSVASTIFLPISFLK